MSHITKLKVLNYVIYIHYTIDIHFENFLMEDKK